MVRQVGMADSRRPLETVRNDKGAGHQIDTKALVKSRMRSGILRSPRGCSSVGRALRSQRRSRRFESAHLHSNILVRL